MSVKVLVLYVFGGVVLIYCVWAAFQGILGFGGKVKAPPVGGKPWFATLCEQGKVDECKSSQRPPRARLYQSQLFMRCV